MAISSTVSPSARPIVHPCAWRGDDIAASSRWTRTLEHTHIAEIVAATERVVAEGKDWQWVTRERFPLDTTNELLAGVSAELEDGCGMLRLSGLPIEQLDDRRLRIAWVGLSTHLGTLRSQNADGELLRGICDEGADIGTRHGQMSSGDGIFLSSRARSASAGPLRYHTDRTDVVGLLCVRQAARGGLSRIASAVAVHNEMLARRPDLAELLYHDIHRSRLGEERGGENMCYPLPVFAVHQGQFTSHYSRTFVEAAQKMPDVPRMSAEQWQALDLLAELADELCLETRLAPGDMQFLNNHVIYHSRTAFEDGEDLASKRLLYRVWLSVPNSRPLPPGHAVLFGDVEAGALRGGIRQSTD